jgi:hypothetical protein
MLWAQAPKCGSRSVYPSRRRLRGSLPVVWHDRTRKGQRRSCAAYGAVGADGTRRAITLTSRAGCLYSRVGEKRSSRKLGIALAYRGVGPVEWGMYHWTGSSVLVMVLDTARLPVLEILRNKRPRNKLFLLILFANHQHWAVGMANH